VLRARRYRLCAPTGRTQSRAARYRARIQASRAFRPSRRRCRLSTWQGRDRSDPRAFEHALCGENLCLPDCSPSIPFWRFVSALIRLASTAKFFPPTSPSSMQRRNTVSNTRRNRSLCVPVLREGRMIGHIAVQPEATEPPIRQIEVNLLAQPPLRSDAEAIADQQHPDHQSGSTAGRPRLL